MKLLVFAAAVAVAIAVVVSLAGAGSAAAVGSTVPLSEQDAVAGDTRLELVFVSKPKAGCMAAVSAAALDPQARHMTQAQVSAVCDDPAGLARVVETLETLLADAACPVSVRRTPLTSFVKVGLCAGELGRVVEACVPRWFPVPGGSDRVVRCGTAQVGAAERGDVVSRLKGQLGGVVLAVGGLGHVPRGRASLASRAAAAAAVGRATVQGGGAAPKDGVVVDPRLIRKLYGIGDTRGGKDARNSQAVAQFLKQYYSQVDLEEFFTVWADYAIGTRPRVVGPNHFPAGSEASLDIQYMMSLSAHTNTTFWSTGGTHANQEPFLEWLHDVAADPNPPALFSVSYGDDESSLDVSFAQAVNLELAKGGARGISFLFASGDDGVGCLASGKGFAPNFPASSPWVTAVGGTALGLLESGPEHVNGLSSGGFSNVFGRPAWQDAQVAHYLSGGANVTLPPAHYYNATSRGYPDVAALSSGFSIVLDLVPLPGMIAGTSCASPTFGAVMALVNDARLAAGKQTLGFLNSFLYTCGPGCFNPIKSGGNPDQAGGCGGECFFAAPDGSWSPTAGLGSPNFAGLVRAALAYP